METATLQETINTVRDALSELEEAKADCNVTVSGALSAYFGDPVVTSKAEFKLLRASQKSEAKNIKKIAKALLNGKKDEVEDETDSMRSRLEQI